MPDFYAIATALAGKYDPATLAGPPAEARDVVSSTANLPDQLGATPCVLTFLTGADLRPGTAGHRVSVIRYAVRLYYDQSPGGVLERDMVALERWATIMADALDTGSSLGGVCRIARVVGLSIGALEYAGARFSGLEVAVEATVDEARTVTA